MCKACHAIIHGFHHCDRSSAEIRLPAAHRALREAVERIAVLERFLKDEAQREIDAGNQERAARFAAVAGGRLAWQDDPEIDWTGIDR